MENVNYKEGTILYVKKVFDANSTSTSIESISICKDEKYIEGDFGTEGRQQDCFVINCFEKLEKEEFTNHFIYNKKEVNPGDKVYVVITNDYDPYGDKIIGVFTEMPDKEFIWEKYVEEWNKACKYDYDKIDTDWAYVSQIIEVVVSKDEETNNKLSEVDDSIIKKGIEELRESVDSDFEEEFALELVLQDDSEITIYFESNSNFEKMYIFNVNDEFPTMLQEYTDGFAWLKGVPVNKIVEAFKDAIKDYTIEYNIF